MLMLPFVNIYRIGFETKGGSTTSTNVWLAPCIGFLSSFDFIITPSFSTS
jgi:hypothetical protein